MITSPERFCLLFYCSALCLWLYGPALLWLTVVDCGLFFQDVGDSFQIKVGDSVYVVQKTKKTLGVITDIKIKKALVRMNGSMYNVPLSMIEPVEEL